MLALRLQPPFGDELVHHALAVRTVGGGGGLDAMDQLLAGLQHDLAVLGGHERGARIQPELAPDGAGIDTRPRALMVTVVLVTFQAYATDRGDSGASHRDVTQASWLHIERGKLATSLLAIVADPAEQGSGPGHDGPAREAPLGDVAERAVERECGVVVGEERQRREALLGDAVTGQVCREETPEAPAPEVAGHGDGGQVASSRASSYAPTAARAPSSDRTANHWVPSPWPTTDVGECWAMKAGDRQYL